MRDWTLLRKLMLQRHLCAAGLPDGYTEVAGFEFAANCYFVITDFKLRGSDTIRLSFSVDKACNIFGCYTNTSATDNYSLYVSTAAGAKYLRYNGGTYNSRVTDAQMGQRFDAVITPTGSSGMPNDDTWDAVDFTASVDMCIGTTATSASSSKLDGCLYGRFKVDGRLNLIPCKRDSDDKLGYYDTVSGTFYLPTTGTPTALPA